MNKRDEVDSEPNTASNGKGRRASKGALLLQWLSQLARGMEKIDGLTDPDFLARMPTKLGPFRLEGLLGSGTYGVVFRAFDTGLERHVALKVAWPYVMYDPVASRRFVEEPKAVASMDHPGIVKVHKSGWVGSVCYIALELIDGPSLNEWCKAQEQIPAPLAARIVRDVARAIQFVHARNTVHRDIKPSNILLRPNRECGEFGHEPVVTDLGLARRPQASTFSDESTLHAIVGTDHYMSPEQAAGRKATTLSDVFSLGVVLYELVSGQRPFDGEHSDQVRQRIQYDNPPSIRGRRRALCPKKISKQLS